MVDSGLQPWLFNLEPYDGESLSHFLGRVRRSNNLSASGLGQLANIGSVIARWERFHLIPYPTQEEFESLGTLLEIAPERLWEMLPSQGEGMQCEPIRLCGACYGESPCHRIEWQYKSMWKCDRHNLKLLSKCPQCEAKFKIPSLWIDGRCHRCRMDFRDMATLQLPSE